MHRHSSYSIAEFVPNSLINDISLDCITSSSKYGLCCCYLALDRILESARIVFVPPCRVPYGHTLAQS
ncbi:hypothetical protein M8J76_007971 [Diaphorina citri]|nr:hypothetical protein M8J75_012378 [Diaphorina citri]KAI5723553.1 hypothetical protein M8J76_007971 [Diaphorina citri]